MDIAQLGFEVDTKQLEKAVGLLERLEKGGSGNGIVKIQQDIEKMNRSIQSAMGFVKGLVGAFLSFHALRGVGQMADTWSDLTSQVRLAVGEHEDAADVMRRLAVISRQTYSAMELTAETFTRNATTLNALNKSTQQQLDYAQALNNALVVSGAKADRAAMVQNSLAKAMAEGTLRGEELNNVLNYGSRVATLLAEELGTDVTQLRALAKDGKITGDVLFNALVKNMEKVTEEAESMPATLGDAFTLIQNAVLQLVGVTDQATESTGWLAEILITVADAIDIIAPEVQALASLWRAQADEQEGVATSAEDIAYAMKTVVTGIVIAKNTIDVLIDGFVLAGRMAGVVAGAIVETFTRMGDALDNIIEAIKNPFDDFTVADALRKNMAMASDIAGRALNALVEESEGFKDKFTQNVADVADAFEFLEGGMRSAESAANDLEGSAGGLGSGLGGLGDAATDAGADLGGLYTHLTKIADATDDVDAMLRSLTRTLADDATRAQMDYQDNLADILDLEMQWMALGPLSMEQIAKLNEARAMAGELYRRDIEALNDETLRSAERAAEESTRAWERFSYGLADAVLDGSKGVKRWWKAMLDDMKRQLIQSGLLRLFGSLFNTGGGAGFSLAGVGAGIGFGSILQLAGGLSGGTGGGLLSGLATAISGGVANGLMSLGGGLAGLGMGGLGGGLAWAGGSVAANGLIGGLGGSFMTGLGNLFGAGGGALMGIGQMIPAIAAIAGVAAAIQKISGGKLFGTSYQFDSAGRTLDFSATGASGQDRVTEVRQRSLFRGRRWRDTFSDLPDDVADAIGQFWDEVAASNIAIAGDAARTVGAQIRQEFDRDGNVTKTIVEVLGRTWEESLEEAMTRIAAENMIANIDAMLGTTVQRAITGPGTGVGPGTGPGFVGPDIKDPGVHDTIIKATQTVGEAFAIAERWRHDAELLAEGAQFLLAAASDIQRGAGLLGDEGGLTAITDLIEDLSRPGESLVDTYVRVATSTALLDQALALSGVQIEGTREHIVRLATDITTAAGGLERASALWGNYFDRFYTGIERGEYVLAQAQASAAKEFGDIGLDYTQFTGEGGTQAFRELFEAVLPTLSAEAIVEWLEAAAALGIVIDATAALNAELGEAAIAVSQTSEQLAAVNDILAGNAWELALAGMTNAEAAIARINQKYDEQRKELLANAATLEQLAELEGQRQQALAQQAEAAQRQIDDILGGLQRDIDSLGMSEYEREVANIHKQRADYIAALVETGMSLADATIATRAWRDAMLEAAEAAEAARQQRLLDRRSDILGGLQTDIDRLGMTDYEIAVADVHAKRQDHIAALVDTGMSLADATIATREWRDAMLESVRAAEQARILKPLADDLKSMRQQLADFGLSDFARRQAQIARETQDALAAAQAAGATAAELMTISLNGAERAMLAAALAAKGFTAELEGWEFEESLIGLSESEAQLARINKTWEERYLQAVEIFGEGSEEAIRVLGLWDRAVARAADVSTRAMNAINVSGRSIAETMELVQTFYDNLMSKLGHVIGGDPMADWLSELSGLPKLAQQAVRRPLSEVVQLVRNEYLLRAADLNRQIEAAQHQLSILPWDAQAQRRELEHRIGTLHYALGAISDGMGNALDTLKDMYIASLQGVRDYLDSMLLGDLSALTPAERIAEAWDQLTAAVEAGEGDAATRLADTYLRLLREFEASGEDYNAGFYAVRDLLEGMFDVDWDALLGPDAATDSDNLAHMAGTVDAQLAAAQVANDWLAQIAANTSGGWGLPSYDVGTYNVPQTGPAILHAGEMVLPRPMADAMRRGAFGGGDTQALETRLDAVIARLDRIDRTTAQGAQAVSQAIVTTGATSDRNNDASRARHAQAQRRGVTA